MLDGPMWLKSTLSLAVPCPQGGRPGSYSTLTRSANRLRTMSLTTSSARTTCLWVSLASACVMVGGALVVVPSHQALLLSLKEPLEQRFARTSLRADDHVAGIIVLGGSSPRIRESAHLASRFPNATLVVTGVSDRDYALAQSLVPNTGRLVRDVHATNTFENALFSKRLVNPRPEQRWLLVTSAVHMPRAMGVFAAAGFPVEPWPVSDAKGPSRAIAQAVRHEILGLIAYRIMGRTNALFPGPAEAAAVKPDTAAAYGEIAHAGRQG